MQSPQPSQPQERKAARAKLQTLVDSIENIKKSGLDINGKQKAAFLEICKDVVSLIGNDNDHEVKGYVHDLITEVNAGTDFAYGARVHQVATSLIDRLDKLIGSR